MKSPTVLVGLVMLFAFIGLADAWYLAQSAAMGAELICDINGLTGCNQVAQSPYSRVGGIPLAFVGVAFYTLVFVTAALIPLMPRRILYRALLAFGLLGLAFSLYFMYLQLFVIKATCIYCAISAAVSVIICLLGLRLWKRFAPPKLVVVP